MASAGAHGKCARRLSARKLSPYLNLYNRDEIDTYFVSFPACVPHFCLEICDDSEMCLKAL